MPGEALAAGGPARTLGGCRVAARGGRLILRPETRTDSGGTGGAPAEESASKPTQPLVPGGFTVAKLNVNIM